MEAKTQNKISQMSRYLYLYATFIIVGLIWNVMDGEIESMRDFIRGTVRAIVMIYLSKTIWDLKKAYWWVIVGTSCAFALLGIMGIFLGLVGGVIFENKTLFFIGIIVIPATILLAQIFYLAIQKDVRQQFVH